MPDGSDLEHHHADGVGDDVVQFARDPHALFRHCDARRRVPVSLGLVRADLGRLGLLDALAERESRYPGDRELERDEDHLGDRVSGNLVDDRRRTADNEEQAQRRLHWSAQVPEQERRYEPEHEEADRERDQPPVDERDNGRQQKVRRRGKGKPPARDDRKRKGRDRRGDRREDEPQRRLGRIRQVASDQDFEHRRDRQEPDQQVEHVRAGEVRDPPHTLKVLHSPVHRLLPG